MTWTFPGAWGFLAVAVALLAAAVGFFRWKNRTARALGGVDRLVDPLAGRRQRVKALLYLLAVLALGIALTGPRWGQEFQDVRRRGVDVVIAVDVSTSMLAEDVTPNRLTQAKRELGRLIDGLNGDRVGVVAFAGTAFLQCPLTLDYAAARSLLDLVGPGLIPRPGTSLAAAIDTAVAAFPPHTDPHRALVLLTDGEDHSGVLDAAVDRAARAGVRVFPVGFGSPSGEIIPLREENGTLTGYKKDKEGRTVISKMNETALRSLAEKTRGMYFPATDGEIEVTKILDVLNRMEKRDLESRVFGQGQNHYRGPLALALFLLLLEFLWPEVGGHFRRVGRSFWRGGKQAVPAALLVAGLSPAGHALGRLPRSEELAPAVARNPRDAGASFRLGLAFMNEKNFSAAAEAFKKAAGESSGPAASAAHYNAGNAFLLGQDLPQAVSAYKAALRWVPSDPDAKYNLEMAQRLLKASPEKKPDSPRDGEKKPGAPDPGGGAPGERAADLKPGALSREDAARLLNAVADQEKDARRKARTGKPNDPPTGDDW